MRGGLGERQLKWEWGKKGYGEVFREWGCGDISLDIVEKIVYFYGNDDHFDTAVSPMGFLNLFSSRNYDKVMLTKF